jgi:hypothetical protein
MGRQDWAWRGDVDGSHRPVGRSDLACCRPLRVRKALFPDGRDPGWRRRGFPLCPLNGLVGLIEHLIVFRFFSGGRLGDTKLFLSVQRRDSVERGTRRGLSRAGLGRCIRGDPLRSSRQTGRSCRVSRWWRANRGRRLVAVGVSHSWRRARANAQRPSRPR